MELTNYDHFSAALNQCDKELDELYHKYAMQHHLSDAALWILYAIYDAKDGITQLTFATHGLLAVKPSILLLKN